MDGPFDKYLGPWDKMRRSNNVDDRRDDPWPWSELGSSKYTRTDDDLLNDFRRTMPPEIPPVTKLSRDAGARDVGPISKEELLNFLLQIESFNPDPPIKRKAK